MLKPRVGLIESMSSPLNFFTMVVLPALSRPLGQVSAMKAAPRTEVIQHKYSDLLLLLFHFLDDGEQAHLWLTLSGRRKTMRKATTPAEPHAKVTCSGGMPNESRVLLLTCTAVVLRVTTS